MADITTPLGGQPAISNGRPLPPGGVRDGSGDAIEQHRLQVALALRNRWSAPEGSLNLICRYALEPAGKMLRPLLLLDSALAVGGELAPVLPAAAGAECGHVASLIHDDIIDHDDHRRGKPSVQYAYGVDAAIIAGDALIFDLFVGLAECRDAGVRDGRVVSALKAVARAGIDLCHGQLLEFELSRDRRFDVEACLRVAELKTAAFFRGACESGAILGGGDEEAIRALAVYGASLGSAFQIQDDLLPFVSEARLTGKSATSDLRNGRLTLPVVLAHDLGGERDRAVIEDCLSGHRDLAHTFAVLRDVIERTGALATAAKMALDRARTAQDALRALPASASRERLGHFADLAVERSH